MKTAYVDGGSNIVIDVKTNEISHLDSAREAISRVYQIKEEMDIIVQKNDKKINLHANEGDLLIVFYDSDFDNPAILVNSKEWNANINSYNAKMQARKEKWAAEKCDEKCGEVTCGPEQI